MPHPPSQISGPWARAIGSTGEKLAAFATHPRAAFASLPQEGGVLASVAYAWGLCAAGIVLGAGARAALGAEVDARGTILLACLAPPLYVYLRSQALHLGLVLAGRVNTGLASTLRVVAYSNGTAGLLLAVPWLGEFLFLLAGAALEATGTGVCHRLSTGAAVAAEAGLAALLVIGLLGALLAGLLWWSQSRA
jgi:hypothetical protein